MKFEYAKRCEKNMLISTILTLVLGIILAISPDKSIKTITVIISFIFMAISITQFIDYFKQNKIERMISSSLIIGIILMIIGLYLFLNTESLIKFITIILGITLVLKALFKIQFAFNIISLSKKWFYNLIVGLVLLAMGVVLIINPFASATVFFRIIGILLAVGSIIELIETMIVIRSIEDAIELDYEEKDEGK